MEREVGDSAIDTHTAAAPAVTPAAAGGLESRLSCALCCASVDKDAVLEALPAVVAMGISAFVVPGVDDDVKRFENALARAASGGLVVLCTSPSMNQAKARRIAAAFTRQRQIFQQFLVLELDTERPEALVRPIRRGLASLRRRLGVPTAVSNPEMRVSDERASVSGAVLVRPDESPPRPSKSASVVLEDGLRDEVGPIPEEIMFSAISRSKPLLAVVTEDTADPEQTAANECPTIEILPIDEAEPVGEAPGRASVGRWWPFAMVLGGALAGSAVWALTPMVPVVDPTVPAQVSVASPDLALVLASQNARRKPRPAADPPTGSTDEPDLEDRPAAPSGAGSTTSDPLMLAAADGRVSALPGFFATKPYSNLSSWHKAANRCRSRSVDGVRGWRLPKPAELRALWRDDQVRDAVYWSAARAARTELPSNWTLDGVSGVPAKREKAGSAATICVRSRPSSEE